MDGVHPSLSRCVVSFSLMVCSGHHISLRLLSLLRVMNISPSRKKERKKKNHQACWGFLGLRHGGSLSSAIHRHYHAISAKVKHWAAQGLSFLGRVHVAKQALAASLWYHASFQRPSEQLLKQLSQQLRKFVASAQQASHGDDAVASAQDCSQGSAHLPSATPGAALFPGEPTSSLPQSKEGMGLVHVPTQVQALQAQVSFFCLGGMNIPYTSATTATSRVCEVHHKQ